MRFEGESYPSLTILKVVCTIKVNPNYKIINAALQKKDPNSPLNYFRRLVKLRKDNLVLVCDKYILLDAQNPDAYTYTRELDCKKTIGHTKLQGQTC
ncbi:alpha-glucosidase [Mucilaginibacter oryzae]|uniref:Alpha-glucosidase n=1 Tax=Mucilaginibacter oryzae TaxID=468058 RepID=A0A316HKE5_9SPHI|nr:hypothetical protein [Mucilaginibacter oryzae]PWK75412.1 alpha-glucosidase [Mucilaginibacter oryzae]